MKGWCMRQHGTTLVELTIAVAIMTTVFAAVLPLFGGIRNSTEARWAALEMVQNARVLNEFLCRHLAEARRVVDVSARADDRGYIEFETSAGSVCRCGVADRGDIEFGPADARRGHKGSEATPSPAGTLAGPVEYLRFTCYDGNDLIHPVTTAGRVRLVTWEAGWRSTSRLTHGRTVSGSCYLRVDAPGGDPRPSLISDGAGRSPERMTPLFSESPGPCVPGGQGKPAPGSGCHAYACVCMPSVHREHGYASVAMAPGCRTEPGHARAAVACVRSVPGEERDGTGVEGTL
jgi:hypothetical protein